MRPLEGERLALRGLPQAGDDGELLLQAAEALTEGRERYAIGGVLAFEPAAPQADLGVLVVVASQGLSNDTSR